MPQAHDTPKISLPATRYLILFYFFGLYVVRIYLCSSAFFFTCLILTTSLVSIFFRYFYLYTSSLSQSPAAGTSGNH